MMINRKVTGLSAALLMAISAGAAFADEGDMTQTQTRTQDRIREQINLQTPDSDQAQARYREQHMEQQTSQQQIRNEFRYGSAGMDQARRNTAATASRQNMSRR